MASRSRSRARTAPPRDMTGLVLTIAVVFAVLLVWLGYPGLVLLPIGAAVAGVLAPMPELTGKRDAAGRPRPLDDLEAAKMRRWRARSEWKTGMWLPGPDWVPGWPVRSSWLAAVLFAACSLSLPGGADRLGLWELPSAAAQLIDAVAVFAFTVEFAGSRRRQASEDEPSPGISTDTLLAVLPKRPERVPAWLYYSGAGLVAAVIVAAGTAMVRVLADILEALLAAAEPGVVALAGIPSALRAAVLDTKAATAHAEGTPGLDGLGLPITVWCVAGGLLVLMAVLMPVWSKRALDQFRERVAARAEWKPRWESLKYDPVPHLVSREHVGPALVDTFEAPPGQSAMQLIGQADKIAPTVGAGMTVTLLETPNTDSKGQPMPGTVHPSRFRIVIWPSDQVPDVTDPSIDRAELFLLMETAVIGMCTESGFGRILIDQVEPVHADDSEKAVWYVAPQPAFFELLVYVRDKGALLLAQARLGGVAAVLNHRAVSPQSPGGPAFYFGAIGDPGFTPDPENADIAELIDNLLIEWEWNARWGAVLKSGVNFPRADHSHRTANTLADGTLVHRQPFLVLEGEQPTDYYGFEEKLKTTSLGAPFVSTTGFLQADGERNPLGLVVNWTDAGGRVPRSPSQLRPPARLARSIGDMPEAGVLAGMVNRAFDAARFAAPAPSARPDVYGVRALTSPRSRTHIWQVDLRLYAGVTMDMVRAKAKVFRETLQIPWVRVTQARHGVSLLMGDLPDRVTLADESRDRPRIVALDWAQAFDDANIRGSSGDLPQLVETHTLPHNEKVRSIDFSLPPGVEVASVRGKVGKLTAATGNAFIDVRQSAESASKITMLVSETDPMPTMVGYPFDNPVDPGESIEFGVGVDGEPVGIAYKSNPHVILLGGSGSGKSASAQSFMYGAFAAGYQVVLVDNQKQGADFAFARDHAAAFLTSIADARAGLEAVYAEVQKRAYVNGQHGVGSFADLPEDTRPRRIVVFIDEFLGLITAGKRPASRPEDDPEAEQARLEAVELYENKGRIAFLVGRIGAEARSAGVSLVLMTQRLTRDSLPTSVADIKTNAARIILGKSNYGDKVSALRDPDSAPDLGEVVPKGRMIWEPVEDRASIVQAFFEPADAFQRNLYSLYPDPTALPKIDIEPYRPKQKKAHIEGEELTAEDFEVPETIDATGFFFADEETTGDDGDLPEWARAWNGGGERAIAEPESSDDSALTLEPDAEPVFEFDDDLDVPDDENDEIPVPAEPGAVTEVEPVEPEKVFTDKTDTAAPQPKQTPTVLPVRPRNTVGDAETVLLWDIDGTFAPFGQADTTGLVHVGDSMDGALLVRPDIVKAAAALPGAHVWATNRDREDGDLISDALGLDRWEALDPASDGAHRTYWNKTGALLDFLEDHPFVTRLVMADDDLADADNYTEMSDMLTEVGLDFLLVAPVSATGLTTADLGRISSFLGGEGAMAEDEAAAAEEEAVPALAEQPARLKPRRVARRAVRISADDLDGF